MTYKSLTDPGFPAGGKFILIFFAILVVIIATQLTFIFLLVLVPLYMLFFYKKQLKVDLVNDRYKKYTSIFPFTIGEWQDLGEPEALYLDQYTVASGGQFVLMKSGSNMLHHAIYLAIKDDDKMTMVWTSQNEKKTLSVADEMAKHFQVPVESLC